MNSSRMPANMIVSPMRVVRKAFSPASLGVIFFGSSYFRANQKPMSKYEHSPMISQKMNSMSRLSERIRPSMPVAKSAM